MFTPLPWIGSSSSAATSPRASSRSNASRSQSGADRGVVATGGEHSEAGEEVEVVVAALVIEIGALRAHIGPVETDGVQHAGQLRVEHPRLQVVALAGTRADQCCQVRPGLAR